MNEPGRRHFLSAGAMAMVAAHFGGSGMAAPAERGTRELAVIGRAAEWLNTPASSAANLHGKVVLVDFFTYTCINWLRTLPYVRAWAQKYGPSLAVIGVHTPEFPFESDVANVRRAVQQLDVAFPVVIDNDYAIWRAFSNQYWPALYLLDERGRVREHYFGEGQYERSEIAIQRLLSQAGATGARSGLATVEGRGFEAAADWSNLKSPETYVGHERTQHFASRETVVPDRRRNYTAPSRLALNQWALTGEWSIGPKAAVLHRAPGRLEYRFHARDVHMVMRPSGAGSAVRFQVTIDGHAPDPAHGLDVDEAGNGTVTEGRLYQLVRQPKPIVDRTMTMEFVDAGVEVFSLTFG